MTPLEAESKGYDSFHRRVKWSVDSSYKGVIFKENNLTPGVISGNKFWTPHFVINQLKIEYVFTTSVIKCNILHCYLQKVD